MKTAAKKLYEAMFLVDPAEAGADIETATLEIEKMLKKAEADVISIKKWDERRLAYKIGGRDRGTYILSYFKADGQKITDIERSIQLSEKILRVLILNAEAMSQEDIEKETPAARAEKQQNNQNTGQEPTNTEEHLSPNTSVRPVQ